jgi:hypothetical protein
MEPERYIEGASAPGVQIFQGIYCDRVLSCYLYGYLPLQHCEYRVPQGGPVIKTVN